jgi:hypothetical protein
MEENSVVEKSGLFKVCITFREKGGMVPIIKNYILNLKLLLIKEGHNSFYLNNLTDVKYKVKKALSLPEGSTILNQNSYIGTSDNLLISLEVITTNNFVRRLKTDEIINEI